MVNELDNRIALATPEVSGSPSQALRAEVLRNIRLVSKGQATIAVEAAGRLLGIGRDASYAAAARGTLPTIKVCERRWRVSVAVIEKLLLGD